jgi:hypothetical protein
VGCATSQQLVKSHAHTESTPLSWRRMASLVGSAAAWSSRTSGSIVRFMPTSILTNIDIDKYQYSSTDRGSARPGAGSTRSHE